jgi:hypothetical protein
VIARYIDVPRAHKFNFIRMMAMADGCRPFFLCPPITLAEIVAGLSDDG